MLEPEGRDPTFQVIGGETTPPVDSLANPDCSLQEMVLVGTDAGIYL